MSDIDYQRIANERAVTMAELKGEVDRLRNCLRTEIEAGDSWKREAEDLRAQLAKAHALLRTGVRIANGHDLSQRESDEQEAWIGACNAALSASADPGEVERLRAEPTCCEPTAEELAVLRNGDYRPEELWGGSKPTCPKCCNAPVTDERAEFIKAMNRDGWLEDPEGGGDAVAAWRGWEARAALSASAEPSAPVERSDGIRTQLEKMIGQAEYMLELAENSHDPDEDEDDGSFDECREYIEQARAALSASAEELWGGEDLKTWFGLSYASWLTIPRVLLEAMPDVWQGRLAVLLHEYEDAFPNHPEIGTTVRCTKGGRIIKTPDWMVNYRHPDQAMLKALRGDS
ncbi:hypothetical protein Psp6_00031 [Pseudomonas phage Psp6]|nr:hypothetical protein Psp6_00031 [Pseudomonas phage Psp6]